MCEDEMAKLAKAIAECRRLRKLLRNLDTKAGQIDGRLIESKSPEHHPDDPPETRHR